MYLARAWVTLTAGAMIAGCSPAMRGGSGGGGDGPLIRRTAHGVPHILADDLHDAGFALAWVQLEDYGGGVVEGMEGARGRLALHEGERRVGSDAVALLRHRVATREWRNLRQDTRDVYAGFAAGINAFIRVHPDRVPEWAVPDFTGIDVLARDVSLSFSAAPHAFNRRIAAAGGAAPLLVRGSDGRWVSSLPVTAAVPGTGDVVDAEAEPASDDIGSNAWALGPARTTSGRSILLRNPHLAWSAGYYEAHVRVPGKLDFYGDFRIGGPFTTIGGFNRALGFSTTNNNSRSHEIYALELDPARADHYRLDGRSRPLIRDTVVVSWRDSLSGGVAVREFWSTEAGPVIARTATHVYVNRATSHGDFRAGEQWLAMMQAGSLEEWRQAMRIHSRTTSNFTYADRDGNILYVWMSGAPILPHPSGGDSLAILATGSDQIWSRRASFDELPQLLNPPGGYVRNENDSPHFTNLAAPLLAPTGYWMEPRSLRLRSQLSLETIANDRIFSLEDVVAAKHTSRILLADRVKGDLLAASASTPGDSLRAAAAAVLAGWDNTARAESRGGVLFETWWNRYRSEMRDRELHAVPWDSISPVGTPRGLADPAVAVDALGRAAREMVERHGALDLAWGDLHRVRRGGVDLPAAGCGGAIGCFRVMSFAAAADGKRVVNSGDGWVIAVEFGDEPRAYSILAYGQSPDSTSPYHASQAAMFARGEMKPVYWSESAIARAAVRTYRPGIAR